VKLLEFAVTGYKNLTREIRLTDLGRVNVIHGDNNVGKSNLLESLHLFFALLGRGVGERLPLGPENEARISEPLLQQLTEHRFGDIFNLRGVSPGLGTIHLEGVFAVSREDLARADIKPLLPTDRVTIAIDLQREYGRSELRLVVTRFQFGDGPDAPDAARKTLSDPRQRFVHSFALFLTRNQLVHDTQGRPAFTLIEENRRLRGYPEPPTPSVFSPQMLLDLLDASTSTDPAQIARWKLLKELVKHHLPPFDEGELLVAFDRHQGLGFLMHEESNATRMRHHQLGSGVQQALSLLGLLVTTPAGLVGIEEPECNLRYSLQLRLREAFDALTRQGEDPKQLFLTSHSPAFETESHFYGMRLVDGVPVVERRPVEDVAEFVGLGDAPPRGRGKRSYVTSDGLVEVPPFVLEDLDLRGGGRVFFATRNDGHVEMLSHAQFMEILRAGEGDDRG
jgi:hypothetical protein